MRRTIAQIIEMVGGEWLGSTESLDQLVTSVTTDSRSVPGDSLFVPILGDQFDGHQYVREALDKGAIMALWKRDHSLVPPLDSPILVVEDPLESLQKLAYHYRQQVGCLVVAITGSNGKTTTKDIVSSILSTSYRTHANKGNLNNHIGMPLTILAMPENTEIAVLEMGMNHFGEIELLSQIAQPNLAIITNIGDAHIAHLGSRAGIAQAKLEILSGMNEEGILFYPGDEPLITDAPSFKEFKGQRISCGVDGEFDYSLKVLENLGVAGIVIEDQYTDEHYHLPIPGLHNAQNAAYGLAVGTFLQLNPSTMSEGLQKVSLSKMRMEMIKGKNGATIINDAYNASLISMRAALQFLADLKDWQRKIVVLGDIGELGSYGSSTHQELGKELSPVQFPIVYVTGTLSKHIVEGALQAGYTQVQHIETKEQLIKELQPLLDAETIILVKASRFMELEQVVQSLV